MSYFFLDSVPFREHGLYWRSVSSLWMFSGFCSSRWKKALFLAALCLRSLRAAGAFNVVQMDLEQWKSNTDLMYGEARRKTSWGFAKIFFLGKRQMKFKIFGRILYQLTFSTIITNNLKNQWLKTIVHLFSIRCIWISWSDLGLVPVSGFLQVSLILLGPFLLMGLTEAKYEDREHVMPLTARA